LTAVPQANQRALEPPTAPVRARRSRRELCGCAGTVAMADRLWERAGRPGFAVDREQSDGHDCALQLWARRSSEGAVSQPDPLRDTKGGQGRFPDARFLSEEASVPGGPLHTLARDEKEKSAQVASALLLPAVGVAQSRLGKAAARVRHWVPERLDAPTSRRTASARGTRWPFSEPTLRSDPVASPGVYATATAKRSSVRTVPRLSLLVRRESRPGTTRDASIGPTARAVSRLGILQRERQVERPAQGDRPAESSTPGTTQVVRTEPHDERLASARVTYRAPQPWPTQTTGREGASRTVPLLQTARS